MTPKTCGILNYFARRTWPENDSILVCQWALHLGSALVQVMARYRTWPRFATLNNVAKTGWVNVLMDVSTSPRGWFLEKSSFKRATVARVINVACCLSSTKPFPRGTLIQQTSFDEIIWKRRPEMFFRPQRWTLHHFDAQVYINWHINSIFT